MDPKILFFTDKPPEDREAIHIWLGKPAFSHEDLLQELVGRYLGPSFPQKILYSNTRKPYLAGTPLHFNLSDVQEWVAVAFHWNRPVGIDIERIQPVERMEQLIQELFSLEEQQYVQEKEPLLRFWEIWTRKEACLKALGIGLQDNMREWSCAGRRPWTIVKNVAVHSLPMPPSLAAAVAISS